MYSLYWQPVCTVEPDVNPLINQTPR